MKAFIFCVALTASASANAQSFDASRQIDIFTREALKSTLAELGAETEDQEGKPNITARFSNGLVGDVLLMACDDAESSAGCLGTSILVSYTTPGDAAKAQVRDGIDEYNYRQNFGRAYLDPNGAITLRFYLIADGGISMENYRRQLDLFAQSAAKFPGYIYD